MEPNSAIGLANRLVAPFVQRAYTAFPESERHFKEGAVLRTGVPIRKGFEPKPYGRSDSALRILVLGGSQGAQSLNEIVPRAFCRTRAALRVVHQVGRGHEEKVRALYDALGASGWATVVGFIDDMPSALAAADLVVGRAGASAVAEICAVGRPSILIPYPFAGDHQRHNAESLARRGAALCVLAPEATEERLAVEIEKLASDPARLPKMAASAKDLGRPDAALVIARDLVAFAGLGDSARFASDSSAQKDTSRSPFSFEGAR
jgi:UDP-N-acetylglucosamine--N-acetylmuramyl-(pentapeptide) pyrophosphoryl-undecaprenol N-acetylglucosamine transferase